LPKPDEAEDKDSAPAGSSEDKLAPKEGERILRRDADDEGGLASLGKGKQKPKGKKPAKAQSLKPDAQLKHQINVLVEFEKLSLAVPSTAGAVPQAIQELKQKKEHFKKLGVEEKAKLEAQVAKQKAEDAAKAAAAGSGTSDDATSTPSGDGTLVEASA